jgi:hypothetical protein
VDHKINSIDVRADFAGHELGTADSTENWLNGFIIGDAYRPGVDDDGEPESSWKDPGSFHPNVSGNNAYATLMSDRLFVLDYHW